MTRERHPNRWADGALFDRILAETTAVTDRNSLDRAVLAAVQKAFLTTRVELGWFLSHGPHHWVFLRGASVERFGQSPTPILRFEGLPAAMQTDTQPRAMRADMSRQVTALADGVDFRLRWTDADVSVEMRCHARQFIDLPQSTGAERQTAVVADLSRSRTGLAEVVQVLRPMHRFAHQSAVAETRRQVETWLTDTRTFELHDQPDLPDRARRATQLVDHARLLLNRPESTALDRQRIRTAVERVVRSIVHTVQSAGWRTKARTAAPIRARESERLDALVTSLDALPAPARGTFGPTERMDVTSRLALLRSVLDAAASATATDARAVEAILPLDTPHHLDDQELRLFAAWSIVHDLAHTQAHRRTPAAQKARQAWDHALRATRAWLPAVLAAWTTPTPRAAYAGRNPFHAGAVRNWLYLWFAHHVLPDTPVDRPNKETWRFRRALARVFRETLRAKVYSSSPGYTHRPDRFTDALQLLVDRHVTLDAELQLPHNIRGHLALVGDAHHPRGPRFSDGHLQHVLELYVAGHFMLSAHLDGAPALFGTRPMAAAVLANPRGGHLDPRRTRDLLATWSLAALYHDVGLSLFPEFRTPRDFVTRMHPAAAEGLDAVRAALHVGGTALATRARDALVEAKVYDPIREPGLHAWIEEQIASGHPNHALTGAWYLQCAAGLIDGLRDTIRKQAVRAVLLHAAPTHTIDPHTDPAASLLALCDELFDWDPSDPPHRGATSAHTTRPTRTAALRFTQLQVTAAEDGRLIAAFHLDRDPIALATGAPPAWPRIELRHIHPEKLGEHVFPFWLAVAQNICRLQPATHGFAPVLDLHGPIPRLVRRTTESSHNLLDALLDEPSAWGPPVLLWFRARLPVPVSEVERDDHERPIREVRRVFPIGRAITDADLRAHFTDLRDAAQRYLLEYDQLG